MSDTLSAALERGLGWREEGVIHIAAVWANPDDADGPRPVLRITDGTPRSAHDALALSLCRARADAVVTTGRILREEPELRHGSLTHGIHAAQLQHWRRTTLGRPKPLMSVVLTRSGELDFLHPFFASDGPVLVLTGDSGAVRARGLARSAGAKEVEIVARPAPGLRDAATYLREQRGAQTVLLEAGPSTAAGLYEAPLAVDELVLSRFLEPTLAPALRGGAFPPAARIEELFGEPLEQEEVVEESGRWHLARYRR